MTTITTTTNTKLATTTTTTNINITTTTVVISSAGVTFYCIFDWWSLVNLWCLVQLVVLSSTGGA
jgi:hypothetical protein